jgi:hypothetical protein
MLRTIKHLKERYQYQLAHFDSDSAGDETDEEENN